MGRAKLGLVPFRLEKFDKGYFPNKFFGEIPDGGSSDLKHVIWYRSALRKIFGMDRINSAQAATTRGNGLFYFDVQGDSNRVAVFGNAFYEDVSGTWTDRTGAVTITDGADNLWQFINHQQGANRYLIGVNNVNAPIKWTGSGNAAVLGGSPPANFGSIAKYHDIIFGSSNESLYFSDDGDPETWNASKWIIPFEKTITRAIDNGERLAVFKKESTGSVSGFSYLDFQAEEVSIPNVGCSGRLAATNAFFGTSNTTVIATVAKDGIWLVDQAFGSTKIFGENYFEDLNQANMHKAICAYSSLDQLLYVAVPKDTAECDTLLVVDMISGAVWPCPSIHANSIRSMASMKDDSSNEFIYFVDTNGYAFKFNKSTRNYHTGTATQSIDARFRTKTYDLQDVHSLRVPKLLANSDGNWTVTMAVGFGLTNNDGNQGSINLQDSGDLLGSTFILGASILSGSDYIFSVLSNVNAFGRFIHITFTNNSLNEHFNIRKCELDLKRRRKGSDDK
mgnify:FL=1